MSTNDEDRPVRVTDTRASAQPDDARADEGLEAPEGMDALPPLDWNTFVLSLSTSALMHLGEVADEATPPKLSLAKQTIDLLALLEEKTKGNLSGEEERLLSEILFDLRMRYVAKAKSGSP